MNSVPVTVQQFFPHSPGQIFDAFLDPDEIGKWMFGPRLRDEEVLRIQVDPRTGGEFSFLVRRPAKPEGAEINHVGRYLEISRPEQLSFTWAIGTHDEKSSRVTIRILPRPEGCEANLTHEIPVEWADYVERTRGAWALMLGTMAKVMEKEIPPGGKQKGP